MTIGNQYFVFQKQKLSDFLRSNLGKRQDFQWASLLALCISLGYTIYTKYDLLKSPSPPGDIIILTVLCIFLFFLLVLLGISFCNFLKYRQVTPEYILRKLPSNEVDHDITAVIVVKKYFGDTPKVLVRKKAHWGYMLPYKKVSTPFKNSETLSEMQNFFANSFSGLHATVSYLDDYMIDNVIKFNPNENTIMKFSFGFYTVTKTSYDELARLLKNKEYKDYEWKSISELLADSTTMKNNSEIVNRLQADNLICNISESFTPRIGVWHNLPDQLRVIWNITTVCEFDCAFCATSRKNRSSAGTEPNFETRIRIAEELLRIPGVRIDIAGGDPLKDRTARAAMFHMLQYMAPNNITITSTGKAFSELKHDEQEALFDLCNHFDVSYDFPSSWGEEAVHRGPDYNRQNFQQLKALRGRNVDTTILVTLSKQNTAEARTTDAMLKELSELQPHNITLLRLMPVGKQSYDQYPKTTAEYNPLPTIERFKQQFGEAVKLHCAFRANIKGGTCNMLNEKIGVDHDGNVFACAWAGYLDIEPVSENPFFLGNVLSTEGGMEAIFKSAPYERLHKALANESNGGCRIFSYLESPDSWLEENHDPLYARLNPCG